MTRRKAAPFKPKSAPFKPKPQFAAPRREKPTSPIEARPPLAKPHGVLPQEHIPVILTAEPNAAYAILDSGDGQKIERLGNKIIIRPESQALWRPNKDESFWNKAEAIFTGDTDEEGIGRWRFTDGKGTETAPTDDIADTWPISYQDTDFLGRFTSFRHIGVFPEQAPLWDDMVALIKNAKTADPNRDVRVLNLFGYTGVASLIAAKAGASVTHIDASKKAIGWARENQALAGLNDAPIRWICEDASKFVTREIRRGNSYDIILADPPAYGRGPSGEIWQLFENLPYFLSDCRQIMDKNALGFFLTAYAIRASFFTIHALTRDHFAGAGGVVQSGELTVREESAGRLIATSLYSKWSQNGMTS